MDIFELVTKENLNDFGFYLSGCGALYFFFIYSLLTKTTIIRDAFEKYLSHNISIDDFWLKNKTEKAKSNYVEAEGEISDIKVKTDDWSLRKKFAFWSVDKGSGFSFFLIAFGFILQVISRFI